MSDLALRLLRHGYAAVARERAAQGPAGETEPMVTRLLGRRAVVVRDPAGVGLFYDEHVVRRRGAIPPPVAWLLFGRGAVHGLDDQDHLERKALLIDILDRGSLEPLVADAGRRLDALLDRSSGPVPVFDTLVRAYGPAVLHWAGIDLAQDKAELVSRRLAEIVDGFGFAGAAYARAWSARIHADRWAARLVADARAGTWTPPAGSAVARLAASDLTDRVAGVELLNLLRPTVAVAWLGTFATVDLARRPELRSRLRHDAQARWHFAQEVRRTTPFAPVLAGRLRRPARLHDVDLHPGDLVVLDILGVDLEPARWAQPQSFDPDRFAGEAGDGPGEAAGVEGLVPQGGGPRTGHRCPGEPLTVALLAETARVVVERPPRLVGSHDTDLSRIPTLPGGGELRWARH